MKVILKIDIRGLGQRGKIVEVSDGYGRNYLVKNALAVIADAHAIENITREAAAREKKAASQREKAEAAAKRLASQVFEFGRAAGEKGHLYAGLKESEILAKIKDREQSLAPAAKLLDYSPLKEAGTYRVKLQVLPGVVSEISISVIKT